MIKDYPFKTGKATILANIKKEGEIALSLSYDNYPPALIDYIYPLDYPSISDFPIEEIAKEINDFLSTYNKENFYIYSQDIYNDELMSLIDHSKVIIHYFYVNK